MEKWIDKHTPIAAIEHDSILSKNGDITICFRAQYPECFTRSNDEYEGMNAARIKAINVLPANTLFVQQDTYRSNKVCNEPSGKSFLSDASNRFFEGRNYREHECIISLVRMPHNRQTSHSGFNNLLKSSLVPLQTIDRVALEEWQSVVSQFRRLMQEAGITLERLRNSELASNNQQVGLIEQYLYQTEKGKPIIKDVDFRNGVSVGNSICQFFTLADVDSFPAYCSSRITHDAYSTDRTVYPVGYASSVGLLLPLEHITTTCIFLGNSNESKRRNEKKAKRTLSLALYSRENAISNEAINQYLNELTADSLRPCFMSMTVMTMAPNTQEASLHPEIVRTAFSQIDAAHLNCSGRAFREIMLTFPKTIQLKHSLTRHHAF